MGRVDERVVLLGRPVRDLEQLPAVVVEPDRERATGRHIDRRRERRGRRWLGRLDRRERARAFKDLQILMLDALADPLKRNEAIQQFVRLYRTPVRAGAKEPARSGCTGC